MRRELRQRAPEMAKVFASFFKKKCLLSFSLMHRLNLHGVAGADVTAGFRDHVLAE
jgi:hypothetical protein